MMIISIFKILGQELILYHYSSCSCCCCCCWDDLF